MKIRYRSRGPANVVIPNLLGHAYGRWSDGEIKDIPDDELVRVLPGPGQPVKQAKAIDAILLAGPDFVDDATGVNPDFACAKCGRETTSLSWYDQSLPDGTDKRVRYEDENGNLLCERDYLLAQPEGSSARAHHARVEHSTGHREMLEHLATQSASPAPAPAAPAASATAVLDRPVWTKPAPATSEESA